MIEFGDTLPLTGTRYEVVPFVEVAQASPGSPAGEQVALHDRLVSFEITNSIDNATAQATVMFDRGLMEESLSPINNYSTMRYGDGRPYLDPNCALRIQTSLLSTEYPGPSFPCPIFNGRIDSVDASAGDNLVRVTCRDAGAWLLDSKVVQDTLYGDGATSAEEVMALIMTDFGQNPFFATSLYTPTPSGFVIYPTPFRETSVLEALRAVAQQIGWDVRWFMSSGDTYGHLRFYDPGRVRSLLDWTFPSDQYERMTELVVDDADVRNSWIISYADPTTGLPVERPAVTDADSIARYGLRPARIFLDRAENIRDDAHADAFAAAALADTKDPLVSSSISTTFFPPIELNDWINVLNYDEYNTGLNFAVTGYTHKWTTKEQTTTIQGRGAPLAAYRDYRRSVPPAGILTTTAPTTEYAPEGTIVYIIAP